MFAHDVAGLPQVRAQQRDGPGRRQLALGLRITSQQGFEFPLGGPIQPARPPAMARFG
jgi:hypothetical protein